MTTTPNLQVVKDNVEAIARLALSISVEEADALVAEYERMETLMPLLDPTGWLKVRDNLPAHRRLAAAFAEFRHVLEVLRVWEPISEE